MDVNGAGAGKCATGCGTKCDMKHPGSRSQLL